MTFCIEGIGHALPKHRIDQAEAAFLARQFCGAAEERARLLTALYRRAAVDTRHSVLLHSTDGPLDERQSFYPPANDETDRGPTTRERMECYEASAPDLAVQAASAALEDAKLLPRDVTHLVSVSCSGFSAPGFDVALIKRLPLSRSIPRTHIGFMGCHGALNGLRVAKAFTDADPSARVLVCAVELCSLHQHYGWNPEQIVSNALFADGAAAVVGRASQAGDKDAWRLEENQCLLTPDSEDAMTWRIGDNGFEMALSPRVPQLIEEHLRGWLEEWLFRSGLRIGDISSWAIHPGGPRILTTVGAAVGLSREALAPSQACLAAYGNMSSPTLLFILERLRTQNAPRPCVALAFGPGLTIEAALFR